MRTERTCHTLHSGKVVTAVLSIVAMTLIIIKADDCLLGSCVQVLGRLSSAKKHSIIMESMNKCTFKLILPKTLHFPEKFRFKFKGKGLHIDNNAQGRMADGGFWASLGKGLSVNACFYVKSDSQ